MSNIVSLTKEEIELGCNIAEQRALFFKKIHARDNYGYHTYPRDLKEKNAKESVWAEQSVAKLLNYPFPPMENGERKSPDVGNCIHVRSTYYPEGKLIIRPDDSPEYPYVLVIRNRIPNFLIAGYMMGIDAMKHREYFYCLDFRRKNNPAFNIPQHELNSVDELIRLFSNKNETSIH